MLIVRTYSYRVSAKTNVKNKSLTSTIKLFLLNMTQYNFKERGIDFSEINSDNMENNKKR